MNTHRTTRVVLLTLALGFGMLSLWMAKSTLQWAKTDALTLAHRLDIEQWAHARQPWTPAQWTQAHDDLTRAALISPHDPTIQDLLGTLYAIRGSAVWWQETERRQWYRLAQQAHLRSARLRPTVPGTWFNLAHDCYAMDCPRAAVISLWRKALAAGPHEPTTRWGLVGLALAIWPDAPPDLRRWVQQQAQSSQPHDRDRVLGIAQAYGIALQP